MRGRAGDGAHDLQHLAALRRRALERSQPLLGRPRRRALASGSRQELGLQRAQAALAAVPAQCLLDQIGRHAHVGLLGGMPCLGEARPHAEHAAARVGEHAVEIGRPVDQLDGLEVGVAARSVRDSGKLTGSTVATSVDCDASR
jgi:hypothetical protein